MATESILNCEICGMHMTEEDYNYCDICGDCLEHAVFDDEDENTDETCRNGKEWSKCKCC